MDNPRLPHYFTVPPMHPLRIWQKRHTRPEITGINVFKTKYFKWVLWCKCHAEKQAENPLTASLLWHYSLLKMQHISAWCIDTCGTSCQANLMLRKFNVSQTIIVRIQEKQRRGSQDKSLCEAEQLRGNVKGFLWYAHSASC